MVNITQPTVESFADKPASELTAGELCTVLTTAFTRALCLSEGFERQAPYVVPAIKAYEARFDALREAGEDVSNLEMTPEELEAALAPLRTVLGF